MTQWKALLENKLMESFPMINSNLRDGYHLRNLQGPNAVLSETE
jgi:hypothetical protein